MHTQKQIFTPICKYQVKHFDTKNRDRERTERSACVSLRVIALGCEYIYIDIYTR